MENIAVSKRYSLEISLLKRYSHLKCVKHGLKISRRSLGIEIGRLYDAIQKYTSLKQYLLDWDMKIDLIDKNISIYYVLRHVYQQRRHRPPKCYNTNS